MTLGLWALGAEEPPADESAPKDEQDGAEADGSGTRAPTPPDSEDKQLRMARFSSVFEKNRHPPAAHAHPSAHADSRARTRMHAHPHRVVHLRTSRALSHKTNRATLVVAVAAARGGAGRSL